jgi:glycerophosphoryl diester phosphodiesterase
MTPVRRLLLLGHRGARGVKTIPENTIASFDRALADGCDGFEFDVRLTADGHPILCHDPKFAGIEISKAAARDLPGAPTLQDVLRRYGRTAFLDIELKVVGLEQLTVALLKQFPPQRGYVVSSFLPEVIEQLYGLNVSIPLGLICERKSQLDRWKDLPVEYVIAHYKLLTPKVALRLKEAGKKILTWTVNNAVDMKRMARYDVEGIISDKTALLRRTFEN